MRAEMLETMPATHEVASARWRDVALFFVLACTFTWLADLPLVLAWTQQRPPPAYALPLAGLGAFGPTLAAVVVAGWHRELRGVFGRWRTNPVWIVLGLFTPMAMHLVATLIEVALGGTPAQWFYPPVLAESVAALVVRRGSPRQRPSGDGERATPGGPALRRAGYRRCVRGPRARAGRLESGRATRYPPLRCPTRSSTEASASPSPRC